MQFQVKTDFPSRDMGEIVVRKEGLRDFLKKDAKYLVRSLEINDIIVLNMRAKFQVHTNSGSSNMGQNGGKMHFFGIFSEMPITIWFTFLEKEDIIVLKTCAKF